MCMIDAMEGRELATADIPGAFLQTNYYKGVYTSNWKGLWLPYLNRSTRNYKDLIFTDKRGRIYMYAEAKKAIYRTLYASLIFWGKLSKSL